MSWLLLRLRQAWVQKSSSRVFRLCAHYLTWVQFRYLWQVYNNTTLKVGFDHYRVGMKITHQRTCQIIVINNFVLVQLRYLLRSLCLSDTYNSLCCFSYSLSLPRESSVLSGQGSLNIGWRVCNWESPVSVCSLFCVFMGCFTSLSCLTPSGLLWPWSFS